MIRHLCRDCRQPVLRGLDSDLAGIPVTLDPQPVDQLGEALALIAGRKTFTVATSRDGLRVSRHFDERTATVIRRGSRQQRVHPEHRCGQPLPAAIVQPSTWATGTEF